MRADRQPEFTQIDLEMSFTDTDGIMDMAEGFIKKLMKETIDVEIASPLPRMTFADAMNKYGSDKPDTRFDMLINDISDWAVKTDFAVFKDTVENGGAVKAIVAKNACEKYTRKKSLPNLQRVSVQRGLHIFAGQRTLLTAHFPNFLKRASLKRSCRSLMQKRATAYLSSAEKQALRFPLWVLFA